MGRVIPISLYNQEDIFNKNSFYKNIIIIGVCSKLGSFGSTQQKINLVKKILFKNSKPGLEHSDSGWLFESLPWLVHLFKSNILMILYIIKSQQILHKYMELQ